MSPCCRYTLVNTPYCEFSYIQIKKKAQEPNGEQQHDNRDWLEPTENYSYLVKLKFLVEKIHIKIKLLFSFGLQITNLSQKIHKSVQNDLESN